MALAAQSQAWQIDAREREGAANRAFAMQRAASTGIARRPATGDALVERQGLNRAVADAKATGLYTPAQLARLQIAANMGDTTGVRGLLSKVDKPSARREELGKQAVTVGEIAQKNIDVIQRRFEALNKQMEKNFSPEAQQFLRENPQFAPPEVKAAFAEQERLMGEIENVQQDAATKQQALGLGISMSQQMAFGERAQTRLTRIEAAEQKRIDKQIANAEKLTSVQRANISTERRHAEEIRDGYKREIELLRREFGQYEDESDTDYRAREQSIWNQLADLEGKKQASYGEERGEIQKVIDRAVGKQAAPPKGDIFTTPDGKRYEFTGRYRDGQPWYEPVE